VAADDRRLEAEGVMHAVVVGGSMGGLLAASALASSYARVTVLDRDALPEGFADRRAVPQGRHTHCLLPRGLAHIESLLPGLGDDLVAAGAPTCEVLRQLRWIVSGVELARASTGLQTILASRALIEGHVRRRVRELPGVALVERCAALELVACRGSRRVTGVRVALDGVERTIEADLVVCATGRAAQLPAWLEGLGFPRPHKERLAIDVRYASRRLRMPHGALGGDTMVIVGARPGHPRGLALFAQEDGGWILTLAGYGPAHRPPADEQGFAEFLRTVAPPDVGRAVLDAEPLSVATHGFPASHRWRYERLPAGLLPVGDAICSFNPLYGQGLTVAAAHAVALRDSLGVGDHRLMERFSAAARPATDDAWTLSTGADLALREVRGRRPLAVRAVNRYMRRLHAVAEHDPVAAASFAAVVTMHKRPSHVLRPPLALRVAASSARSGRAATAAPSPALSTARPTREARSGGSPLARLPGPSPE
jgi:2-polyprenyl-6-methoxyphenol hydroxylase-like FAD-dependent oxidoreductase